MAVPSVSPSVSPNPGKTLWYSLLGVGILLGLYGTVQRGVHGLAATYLTSTTPWGAWVAFYIYFVGMSAGAFLLSTLNSVFGFKQFEKVARDALLVAILSMAVAMTFILFDLGHWERFWHALIYWNWTSILGWEIRFYVLYVLLLMAELYFSLRRDLVYRSQEKGFRGVLAGFLTLGYRDLSPRSAGRDAAWLKILGILGIPIAIFGVHGGTGALFGVVKARAYWNTAIFPVVFVISALVSGTALLTIIYALRHRQGKPGSDPALVRNLAGLMIAFLLVDLGLQFFEILIGLYSLEEAELATLKVMTGGPFAWTYWGVQLGLGAVVPLFLYFYPVTARSVWAQVLAAALVDVGILAVRFNIVVPALIPPLLPGLPAGYYVPNLAEWLVATGIISLGALLYTLLINWFPMEPVDERSVVSHE
ncbi:Menaquinone reductase, integral membrane subunit [Neomoorella glycerini]|uniref:Menaquinone reductase, integral membrane subunit n=1 Tax=Neomoorella glycerini TaxID=55779 RepID=A0A6I5ZV45_9FIRM|nr:NrfD/PsrC family molybdoenzyme membrane anchor subunit [Moorella glycerini]QGP93488.1 Menaquinone reductase, integral membrane subunit [Moorella glycerini]